MRGRIRMASGTRIASGFGVRQLLHQPHHVVGEVAEDAGRHRRQAARHGDAAFADQRAERGERVLRRRARSARGPARARSRPCRPRRGRGGRGRSRSSNSARARRRLPPIPAGRRSARLPASFRKAETGVSRSETRRVKTSCGSPLRVAASNSSKAGSTCIASALRGVTASAIWPVSCWKAALLMRGRARCRGAGGCRWRGGRSSAPARAAAGSPWHRPPRRRRRARSPCRP